MRFPFHPAVKSPSFIRVPIRGGALLLLWLASHPASAQDPVDFKTQIAPLLEKRCYECHGEKKQKGGLRLDRKRDIGKGGDSGEPPLVAAKDGEALLLQRITSSDNDEKMPPKGERLTPAQIGLLKTWIAQGANIPDGVLAEAAKHWAYEKPQPRPLPEVKNKAWVRNGLDQWVLARLEKEKLQPSPEADPATLLRRVSLDLTGVPPTLAQVDAFLGDHSPQAYENAVDRLLASPQYGERWTRPWLDQARYADTQGYEKDVRRSMWPYRDWVINALNADMPFDQFTIEQISGDLLPNPTQAQRVATGFHRNTMTNTEDGTDDEEFRYEALVDRVNTSFAVWMGSTMQCAQCHNHKYDPFQTKEYYQAMAFFDQTADSDKRDEAPTMKVYAPGQEAQVASHRAAVDTAEKTLTEFLASPGFSTQVPEAGTLKAAAAKAKKVAEEYFASIPTTSVMAELSVPRVTHRHLRGAYLSVAEVVTPGTPASLHSFPKDQPLNRLGFARWLISKENPLTARVAVNRFWEQYFGRGLVDTVEEFGHQGEPPSHPELLDWLALEFMNQGWKMKPLHKLIVTSATYRQSSKVTPAGLQADPANRLLARGPRVRLEAEQIRDQALQISGLLSSKVGGPSVMPPQPDGLWAVVYSGDKWETSVGEDKYRRGLYTFWRRSNPYPMMVSFDAPSREFCVLRRNRSNTPLQALNTLNDPAFIEAAQAFARKIHAAPGDLAAQITFAFRSCLGRNPQPAEVQRLVQLFVRELAYYNDAPGEALKMAASEIPPPTKTADLPLLAAWTVVSNVLLNLDETITKG